MRTAQAAHVASLDGLRAIAVLLVLAAHMPFIAGSAASHGLWAVMHAVRSGYVGVDLFFVLSGFLITRILLAEREARGAISLGGFYAKRLLRIAPIYYLCVVVCAFAFGLDDGAALSLATFTFNFYHPFHPAPHPLEHTWSLGVEQQFYLIWPFLIGALPRRLGRKVTGALIPLLAIGASLTIAACFEGNLETDLIYMVSPTRMLSLSLGGYLAFRESEGAALGLWTCLGLFALGAGTMAADAVGRRLGVIEPGGIYWTIALAGSAAASLSVVGALTLCRSPAAEIAGAVLGWAPLRGIGQISYGLYLYHLVVLFALGLNEAALTQPGEPPHGVSAARLGLALALSFAIAAASYLVLERPLLRWGGRWLRRRAARRAKAQTLAPAA